MMPRSFSSTPKRRSPSLRELVLRSCLGLAVLLPACGGQSNEMSTDTGNPPVIIAQKLHVVPSDSGVVVSGDAGAVTPGASVAVENVSRGQSRITTAAQDGSFEVELAGTPEDEYRVEARLGGRSSSAPVGAGGGGQTGLAGLEFLLESAQGFTPVAGTTVRLSFETANFGMSAGCNSMSGAYSQCDGKLCASDLSTTDIGCDPPRHSQDEWLADFVTSQPSLTHSGDRLTLTGTDATLEFVDSETADPDRPLTGRTWTIDTLLDGDVASSAPVQVPPTVQFFAAGTLEVNSTCHTGIGYFTASGGTLTLSDMAYTQEVCASMGNPAVAAHVEQVLGDGTVNFEIDAARLTLERGSIGVSATTE